jgi:cyclopropane-fatty-acyl-phospholipid synthase
LVMPIVERNLLPDVLIRMGIRQELNGDLQQIKNLDICQQKEKEIEFVEELKTMPIAVAQESANEQL